MRSRLSLWLLTWVVFAGIAAPATGQEIEPPRDPSAEEMEGRIDELIRQLGSEQFADREAASKSLTEIGHRARAALERATMSPDPEIAFRAKLILDALPRLTHTVLDAMGRPIANAKATVQFSKAEHVPADAFADRVLPPVVTSLSDLTGRIAVPEVVEGDVAARVTVEHRDYGLARCDVDPSGKQSVIRLPLVRRGTEAHGRSITGRLVDSEGEPVAGAVVRCNEVRTPGEGLIQNLNPSDEVFSDSRGEFAYYLPNEDRKQERGELIPVNSRYGLRITVPGDDSFFPVAGRYANVAPVRIELPRTDRFHRFRFEAVGGTWIDDPEQLRQVRVQYDGRQDGERFLIDLGPESVVSGCKLIPGTYLAESFVGGKTVAFLPLIVTADSPEELSFTLPHELTYSGRVVDGVTGDPVSGAIVMGWNSTRHNNLAMLTADDWKRLRETPANPPLDHPAINRLRDFYGVEALVRTDDDGQFVIVREPDQEFYGIMAFDEDTLPYKVRVGSLEPDRSNRVDAGELPLFPAAKIVVRPVFGDGRLSVSPRWLPDKAEQPDWYERFRAAGKSSDREFEYVHWLKLNELQPVFVPAGIRLSVRFEAPYDDQWAPTAVDDVLLDQRVTKDVGALHFAACLPAAARVVDSRGKPVEGIPVRRIYRDENIWSLAHNTDAEGLAHFHLRPDSTGKFWVSDMPGSNEVRMAANLFSEFQLESEAPESPIEITVTDAQIELLRGVGGSRPR